MKTLLLITVILFFSAFGLLPRSKVDADIRKIQNLEAFAKLYGYVRYFFPGDGAATIDWNSFAVYGAERVMNCANDQELVGELRKLFNGFAPQVIIYGLGDSASIAKGKAVKECADGQKLVFWQHKGCGCHSENEVYLSKRINRIKNVDDKVLNGIFTKMPTGAALINKKIKISVLLKLGRADQWTQDLLKVKLYSATGQEITTTGLTPRKTVQGWTHLESSAQLTGEPAYFVFSLNLQGIKELYLDDLRLYQWQAQQWVALSLADSSFEEYNADSRLTHWQVIGGGNSYRMSEDQKLNGKRSLKVVNTSPILANAMFAAHPNPGEVIHEAITPAVSCIIPLSLCIGAKNAQYTNQMQKQLNEYKNQLVLPAKKLFVRAANVIIIWNAIKYFYPYQNSIATDWQKMLGITLREVFTNADDYEFYYTVNKMVARIQDGHAAVYHNQITGEEFGLPFSVDWVEEQVVVTAVDQAVAQDIKVGDRIISMDNMDIADFIKLQEQYISGSPQWKRHNAMLGFGYGKRGAVTRVTFNRSDRTFTRTLVKKHKFFPEPERRSIYEIENSIHYINLSNASLQEIEKVIPQLTKVQGIIFDLRGRPNMNHEVLSYLLTQNDTSRSWLQIPLVLKPDDQNVQYARSGWLLEKKLPHLKAKVVFITNSSAISYAESFLSFVEHYKLGEIISETPTAGANGDICYIDLPGNYKVYWTGTLVQKHNGTQHHLKGVTPTVYHRRTIAGILEGKDELLEKAVLLLQDDKN